MPIKESGSFYIVQVRNIHGSEYKSAVRMLDTNSGAFPVCCQYIGKRAPGPIALPIQKARDPLKSY